MRLALLVRSFSIRAEHHFRQGWGDDPAFGGSQLRRHQSTTPSGSKKTGLRRFVSASIEAAFLVWGADWLR